ncbi:MAG: TlpA family protein disulfide reductase [Chloroflexi bacterium]|nr:TlpA family protein disulfide reductase [Chloroflexota bacterium]
MGSQPSQPPTGGPTVKQRFLALGGLVAIVGVAVVGLTAVNLIGNQGGGEGIEDVLVFEPPRAVEQADLDVGPSVGKLAPDFEISDFDGSRHLLSDFRGTPVYLNFWATWCIPCQIELPDLQILQERHEDDLVVIAVNRRESLDRAKSYFENIPLEGGGQGLDFAVNGIDPDDTLYSEYRALGMPASYFIDRNGVVTKVFNGLINLEMMEEAVAEAGAVTPLVASSN